MTAVTTATENVFCATRGTLCGIRSAPHARMNDTLNQLSDLGVSISEAANALNLTVEEMEQWLCGDLHSEVADIIEVGLTLLLMRMEAARRPCEMTQRIVAA